MRPFSIHPPHSALRVPPSYAEAMRYLTGQPDIERGTAGRATLGLEGIRALLTGLGRPDTRYRSVLIAGTKGKGSTAAMMERAFRAAGYRTGLYTQPHLHTIRERICIDGEPITRVDFASTLTRVRGVLASRSGRGSAGPPARRGARRHVPPTGARPSLATAYELMTAMALQHFAEQAVDVAVLEVGLGGRLDATNAVDADLSVLTSISLDHTQILGSTIAEITREKADIIKPGKVCVTAPQPPEAMPVIRATADARSARLTEVGRGGPRWEPRPGGGWDLVTARERFDDVRLSLRGAFQRTNAAVAVAALEAVDADRVLEVGPAAIRSGLENTSWPGRFEMVKGRGTGASPPGSGIQMVIDGAHNVESACRLREALTEEFGGRPLRYVLGIARDKDVPGIIAALNSPAVREIVATQAVHPRAASAYDIRAAASGLGVPVRTASSVAKGLDLAIEHGAEGDLIVVTGSLYVVAEAREALGLAEPSGERAFDPWALP